MQYISTRGRAPTLDFRAATLTGLASDGGLYTPARWPVIDTKTQRALRGAPYNSLAVEIMRRFSGETIATDTLQTLVDQAYRTFHHDAVAPIRQLTDNVFIMELFHGPTLAFKDFALQLLGRLFYQFLHESGQSCTILGATSGDTGSAAIAGVRGLESIELFMLHPRGRISEVQRRQMTSVADANIHNLAVDGTFDDCQNLVKAAFGDHRFRARHRLAAVNSINWARIAAQVVYYFRAALALGAPEREISFAVPTGNFGNVLAGYVAKKIGLPIRRLLIGSNRNDILTRFFATGVMEKKGVIPSLSPSMDIQISSNFERYLFELLDRDSERLNACMQEFATTGKFAVDKTLLARANADFGACRLDDQQTRQQIKAVYKRTGEVIDPHSIIGVAAALQAAADEPVVVLGTAHPAKFPDAIAQTIGSTVALPEFAREIMTLPERCECLPNSLDALKLRMENQALPKTVQEL